jgi:hypothetical protein
MSEVLKALDEELKILYAEKMKIVLNLIRSNNTGQDAMHFTQSADNLVRSRNGYFYAPDQELKTTKKQGAGA